MRKNLHAVALWGLIFAQAVKADFRHIPVDETPNRPVKPYIKLLGDIDGDGCPDILVASAKSNGAYWYEYPRWTRHPIIESGKFSEQGQLADVDNDGDLDAILPGPNGIYWYENPYGQTYQSNNQQNSRWKSHYIGSDGTNVHDLVVADFDQNGRIDVAARFEKETRKPLTVWFQDAAREWQPLEINNHFGEGLAAGDVDGDGLVDLAVNELWLKNSNQGRSWEAHRFTENMPDQLKVICADLNGDGRSEIIVSPQSRIPDGTIAKIACFFLEAPNKGNWKEIVLAEGAVEVNKVHGLTAGDMDGDGTVDLTTSKRHDARGSIEICIYYNMDGLGQIWKKQVVAESSSHNHVIGDIGCDGDLDILGANWSDEAVPEIWIQE